MKTWIMKDEKKEHLIKRIGERGFKIHDPKEALEEILYLLESYVPDDWRLARNGPEFLIRDVERGLTLVGVQKRKRRSATICKYLDTNLPIGGVSKGQQAIHWDDPARDVIAKRPNLFIGKEDIHEIFKISPLLARQYEKIHPENRRVEYFKLHPLLKKGIHTKYVWIKWSTNNGKIEFVDGPPKDFHGEDFWKLDVCW